MTMNDTNIPIAKGVLYASAVIAMVALVIGFALRGIWPNAIASVVVVGLWLIGYRQAQFSDAAVDFGLIGVFVLAVLGMLAPAPTLLMLLAGVSALTCWSLMRFEQRMSAVKRIDHAERIERQHMRLVLMTSAAGLAVAGLAAIIRTSVTFAAIFFIGLIAAVILSNVIGRWRVER